MKAGNGARITVRGTGRVSYDPDIASICVTAENIEDWSGNATARTARTIADTKTVLERHSILPADITTSRLELSTEKETVNGHIVTAGQKARQTLTVRLHDLDAVGPVFSTLSAINGIEIGNPVLSRENPGPFIDEARNLAVKDAIRKAEGLAEAAGVRIDSLISIRDEESGAAMFRAAGIDYNPEKLRAEVSVTMEFSIR